MVFQWSRVDVRVGLNKAEHRRIDAFELWCWKRLLTVPWTARRSNQSILKEISPGCSLEGLMLKLKLQYFGPTRGELTQWKRPWCWEGLGAEGEGDDRGWDGWMASLTWWTWVWLISGSWWWIGRPGVLRFMGSQRVRHDWVTELNRLNKGPCAIYSRTLLLQEVLDSFINCEEALEIIDFLYPTVISEVHWLSWALKCQ